MGSRLFGCRRPHWDVESPDGNSYVNVGANGHMWGGHGSINFPKPSSYIMLLLIIVVCILAIPTDGASLLLLFG